MSLYLVKDGERRVCVAHEAAEDAQLFVWVPNTRRFHLSKGLTSDFYWDQDFTYEPIAPEAARELFDEGTVGKLDRRKKRAQLERYEADAAALSAEDVLGGAPVKGDRPSRVVSAQARARALAEAKKGVWVAWKRYPAAKRQAAYVAAGDLKSGRVKAVRNLVLESRVQPSEGGGEVVVEVRRT